MPGPANVSTAIGPNLATVATFEEAAVEMAYAVAYRPADGDDMDKATVR